MRGSLIYSGKAKNIYETDDAQLVAMEYKDSLTAGNGEKKGSFSGKGAMNRRISDFIFKRLEERGVPTHLVETLSPTEALVKKVEIIPLEVIVRNTAAGSFSKKYGAPEGAPLKNIVVEFSLKDDALGDPMLAESHAAALGIATFEELDELKRLALKINAALLEIFGSVGLKLVDFKVEFGKTSDGSIILADEITPDSCRLWDVESSEKLDKDRFRRDLGGVEEAYREVLRRLMA
jgi:phosphoribosylaminoimidazole-succinocarboxamide synthase